MSLLPVDVGATQPLTSLEWYGVRMPGFTITSSRRQIAVAAGLHRGRAPMPRVRIASQHAVVSPIVRVLSDGELYHQSRKSLFVIVCIVEILCIVSVQSIAFCHCLICYHCLLLLLIC